MPFGPSAGDPVTLLQSDRPRTWRRFCDTDPVRIGPDTDLTDVAVLMADYNLTKIPVVDASAGSSR